jgi:hypothetical protein
VAAPTIFSGAITGAGNTTTTPVYLGDVGSPVNCLVAVTAASGTTPSLVITLQWSWDNSTWVTGNAGEAFASITGVSSALLTVPSRAPYVRASWPLPGGTTPNFTTVIAIWS